MSVAEVHPQAFAGYGAEKSELYDRLRPTYPPEALSYIRRAVDRRTELNIVEIGSGSGIFTRALLTHAEWSTSMKELRAFEPNEAMRRVFSEKIDDPRVSVTEGAFESTGAEDGWADLIVIATAFHWCLDLEGAMQEFVRVLKPEGTLCFLWIPEDREKAPWVQQCWGLLDQYRPEGSPIAYVAERWRGIFDLPTFKENFSPPMEKTFFYSLPGTIETVTDRCLTWSTLAVLPDDKKEKVRESIRAIIRQGDGMVWVDEKAGIFEVPYIAPTVIMQRKAANQS